MSMALRSFHAVRSLDSGRDSRPRSWRPLNTPHAATMLASFVSNVLRCFASDMLGRTAESVDWSGCRDSANRPSLTSVVKLLLYSASYGVTGTEYPYGVFGTIKLLIILSLHSTT